MWKIGLPAIVLAGAFLSLSASSQHGPADPGTNLLFDRSAYEERALGSFEMRLDPVDPRRNWELPEEFIVNGQPSMDYGAVGALLAGEDASAATVRCSGTMIGCETFLTANHCVAGHTVPSFYHVYLQSEGILPITSISTAPTYPNGDPADLVLLTLGNPVEATQPVALPEVGTLVDASAGRIVGFGHTSPDHNDQGIKRSGEIETEECGRADVGKICWQFDGQLSTTCNIDSGGPLLFRDVLNQTVIGGVTIGGNAQCDTGAYIDTDVDFFSDWIKDEGGDDVGVLDCGSSSLTLSSNLPFPYDDRILSPGDPDQHFYVIPEGTSVLRVSLNGQDFLDFDFNLDASVRRGDWTVSDSCAEDGEGNFAACELDVMSDGVIADVTVTLEGNFDGSYQLVVTALGAL